MNEICFTNNINMDKTENFTKVLDKAKAEKIKDQETAKNLAITLSFLSKSVIFFLQNAIFYAAFFVISTKTALWPLSYIEFLVIHLAAYTSLFMIRQFFKPFNSVKSL